MELEHINSGHYKFSKYYEITAYVSPETPTESKPTPYWNWRVAISFGHGDPKNMKFEGQTATYKLADKAVKEAIIRSLPKFFSGVIDLYLTGETS